MKKYIVSGYAIGGYGQKENISGTFDSRNDAENFIGMRGRTYAGWNISTRITEIDDTPQNIPSPGVSPNSSGDKGGIGGIRASLALIGGVILAFMLMKKKW